MVEDVIFFVTIANLLNIIIYNLDILENGERFDMFYISPYFKSTLYVYDFIYEHTPYIVFLSTYILSIVFGSFIVFSIYNLFLTKQNPKTVQKNLGLQHNT